MDEQQESTTEHERTVQAYVDAWGFVAARAVKADGEEFTTREQLEELVWAGNLPLTVVIGSLTVIAADAVRRLAAARSVTVVEQVAEIDTDIKLAQICDRLFGGGS